MKNSQVSFEYLMVIGFVTVTMIPLAYFYYSYTQDSSDEIVESQLNQLTTEIAGAADSVYYLGEPSQKTIHAYVPGPVMNSSVSGREVIFTMRARKGTREVSSVSAITMNGTLPSTSGQYQIIVKAESSHVQISYK